MLAKKTLSNGSSMAMPIRPGKPVVRYTGFVVNVRTLSSSISLVIHSIPFPSWLGQDPPYVRDTIPSGLFLNIY